MEAPTGTLRFYYKDIKQEIVHMLLLLKYGVLKKWVIIMDRKQDSNAASTPWTFSQGSFLYQEFRRRFEETAWKRRRIETSLVIVMFMLRVMTYVVSYKLFWNWCFAICMSRGLMQRVCCLTLSSFFVLYKLCRCDH